MPPKDFRKIFHPEPDLQMNEVCGDICKNDKRSQSLLVLTPQRDQLIKRNNPSLKAKLTLEVVDTTKKLRLNYYKIFYGNDIN